MASIRFFALLVSLALLSTFSCSTQFSDKLDRKVALTLLRENADALLYDERPICRPFPGLGAPGRVKIAITDITDDLTKMLNQDQQENLAICEAFESEGILRKVQITTEISAGIFSRIRRKWYLYDIVSKEDLRGREIIAAKAAFDSITGIVENGVNAQVTAQISFTPTDAYKKIRAIIVKRGLNIPECPEMAFQTRSRDYAFTKYDDGWRVEDYRIQNYKQVLANAGQRAGEDEQLRLREEQELIKQQENGQRRLRNAK